MIPLLAITPAAFGADYPPIPADLTTPVQQRLAVKGLDGMCKTWSRTKRGLTVLAVSIAWQTYEQLNQSCVQYGTSNSSLTSQVCSSVSTTYPTSRTWANVVTLTGLAPATTYYYKIVSTNSSVDHFLSPRTPGDNTAFNVDIVIDLGLYGKDGYTTTKRDTIPHIQPELNHTTIGALASTVDDYEFVFHPGDFAYADDWYLTLDNLLDGEAAYQAILEKFYDQLAPISGRKLYMASPGNHE